MTAESGVNACVQPLTNQTPNLTLTVTLLRKIQHAIVSIQLNIVTYHTHPDKFIRDNAVAPFYCFPLLTVPQPTDALPRLLIAKVSALTLSRRNVRIWVFQHRQPLKRYSRNGFLILTCHIIRANSNKVRGYKKNVNLSSS